MRRLPALLAISTALLASSTARADDWLALYPECGFGPEARALGRMAMIYPRSGLPAVVPAGGRLVTRVRVPSGLTPPPGIQKDRALRGWSAELVGQSVPLGRGGEHVYRTRVVDVRPDGQSTLVYRASIEVPRWAAPGTYGLRMSAPGGVDAVAGAVRILSPDGEPRLLRLSDQALGDDATGLLEALALAPHDVIVAEGPALLGVLESALPSAPLPAVLVVDDALPLVLRGPDGALLTFGACEDRYAPFELQLEGLERREGRRRRPFASLLSELPRWPATRLSEARVVADGELLTIEADPSMAAELTIRYADDGRGVRVTGVEPTFHPAVTVPTTGQVPTIALRLSIPAGRAVTIGRTEGTLRPTPTIQVEPEEPESGETVRMRVEGEGLATVAWRLEEDITLVGERIAHDYRPVGEQEVHVYAIGEEGVGASVSTTLIVATREERGCGCRAAAGPRSTDLWLIALVLLEMGVRRRNRPSRRRR